MNKLAAQWGAVLLLVVTVYTINFVTQHWHLILLALSILLCGLFLRKTKKCASTGLSYAEMKILKKHIQRSIADTPKLQRYAWSDDFEKLHVQWKEFEATGKKPMRKRTANRKLRRALSIEPTCPIEKEALRIKDQIRKSLKLQRYDWSDTNAQLLEEWRQYETTGKTPIKLSTVERRKLRQSEICRAIQPTGRDEL